MYVYARFAFEWNELEQDSDQEGEESDFANI